MLFDGLLKQLKIGFGASGVGQGVLNDGLEYLGGCADVAGDGQSVSGAGVTSGEKFAGDGGKARETFAFQVIESDAALVIVQLANQVIVFADAGPTEQ